MSDRRRVATLAGLFGLVAGARLAWVHHAGAAVPVWDQWFGEFARLYLPLLAGSLRFGQLFVPAGEHRVATTSLVSLLLTLAAGAWDVRGEIVVGALVRAFQLVLLLAFLEPAIPVPHRPAVRAVVAGLGVIPTSPLNLLSGYQVQFPLVEIFSTAALVLAARPSSARSVAGAVLALLAAFCSMATAPVAAVAAAALVAVKQVARRSVVRQGLLAAATFVALAGAFLLATPSPAGGGPTVPQPSWAALVRAVGFPFDSLVWAAVVHGPVMVLVVRLVGRRAADEDAAWRVVGFAGWSAGLALAIALGRGGWAAPREQHLELLGLPLLWSCAALAILVERRVVVIGAAALALAALATAGVPAVRTLAASVRARPLVEARFRDSVASGDWAAQREEAVEVQAAVARHDPSFMYDPVGRYAMPRAIVALLSTREPRLLALLPHELTGRPPAFTSRMLAGAAAAWPLWIAAGLVLLAVPIRPRPGSP